MNRSSVALAFLGVVLSSRAALADWQWRWNMPLDEVAKELGISAASATRIEGSKQLKGSYTSGDHRFDGTFTFEHSKLRGVSLAAVDPAECLPIERSLESQYGKPDTKKETPGVMTVTTWRTANDPIVWMRVGGTAESKSCVVVYSPREAGDDKGH